MIGLTIKVMAVYFLFILLFGSKEYKIHSAIIFLSCMAPIFYPLDAATDVDSYMQKRELYILYDGATALILSMLLRYDPIAWKQALLLCFATLCHIMIILNIKAHHAGFFYNWYDELIMTVLILQMVVSKDGMADAIRRIQEYRSRRINHTDSCNNHIQTQKTREN